MVICNLFIEIFGITGKIIVDELFSVGGIFAGDFTWYFMIMEDGEDVKELDDTVFDWQPFFRNDSMHYCFCIADQEYE